MTLDFWLTDMAMHRTQASGHCSAHEPMLAMFTGNAPRDRGYRSVLGDCYGIPQIKLMPSGNEAGSLLPR